jgi:hypothetical protein
MLVSVSLAKVLFGRQTQLTGKSSAESFIFKREPVGDGLNSCILSKDFKDSKMPSMIARVVRCRIESSDATSRGRSLRGTVLCLEGSRTGFLRSLYRTLARSVTPPDEEGNAKNWTCFQARNFPGTWRSIVSGHKNSLTRPAQSTKSVQNNANERMSLVPRNLAEKGTEKIPLVTMVRSVQVYLSLELRPKNPCATRYASIQVCRFSTKPLSSLFLLFLKT